MELPITKATRFSHPEMEPWKVFPEQRPDGFGGAPGGEKGMKSYGRTVYMATQDSDAGVEDPPPPLEEPAILVTLEIELLDFYIPEKGGKNGR